MPGKVYCFNNHQEPIHQLTVNGMRAGSINGWARSGPEPYAPGALAVARARHGDEAAIPVFSGDRPTPIQIEWDSVSVRTSIDLSGLPDVSLDDDLILHIAANQMNLTTTMGVVLATVEIAPEEG